MSDPIDWREKRIEQLEAEKIQLLAENAELKARLVEGSPKLAPGLVETARAIAPRLYEYEQQKNEHERLVFGKRLDDPKPQGEE